jgi:glucose-1-phosphate cytidylyltransferase
MKVVILAGGLGTRLAEETEIKPKPLVEIGDDPILWHIMKIYAHFGYKEFLVALGYKGSLIKRYFLDYNSLQGDMRLDLANGVTDLHGTDGEDWILHLIDTGKDAMTGGRLKRLEKHIGGETFMLTYGDGVCNVDIAELVAFHRSHGKLATVTAVHPPARFGEMLIKDDLTAEFSEKPQTKEGWINGGYMVLEPGVLGYLKGDESVLEIDLLERLADEGQLVAYKHPGFWQCMDTLRDKRQLESAWNGGTAPWKVW